MLERLADELVERPPGRETWIIPCVNLDGVLAGTRNNANDVDLNRNFALDELGHAAHGPATTPAPRPRISRRRRRSSR